jgi:hypothetical protein
MSAAKSKPNTNKLVPALFPLGVGVLLGSGATVAMTVGSAKLNVNDPVSGMSFSASNV